MPKEAMNFTFGDLIIIEISLVHYIKELDLSMQSGQYISEVLGKIEYNLAQMKQAQAEQVGPGLQPPPALPVPPK